MRKSLLTLNLIILSNLFSCKKDSEKSHSSPQPQQNPALPAPIIPDNEGNSIATNNNKPETSEAGMGDNTGNSEREDEDITALRPLGQSGIPDGYAAWSDLNDIDPKSKNLLTLTGEDPVNVLLGEDPLCEVYVLAHYLDQEGKENFALRTSYNHNGDTHAYLIATIDPSADFVTAIDSDNKSQAFFKLSQAGDFLSSVSMNLKWFHINHYDTGVCENFRIREKK